MTVHKSITQYWKILGNTQYPNANIVLTLNSTLRTEERNSVDETRWHDVEWLYWHWWWVCWRHSLKHWLSTDCTCDKRPIQTTYDWRRQQLSTLSVHRNECTMWRHQCYQLEQHQLMWWKFVLQGLQSAIQERVPDCPLNSTLDTVLVTVLLRHVCLPISRHFSDVAKRVPNIWYWRASIQRMASTVDVRCHRSDSSVAFAGELMHLSEECLCICNAFQCEEKYIHKNR